MCLIAIYEDGRVLPTEAAAYAATINRDGFGLMGLTEDGQLWTHRSMSYSSGDDVLATDLPYAIHWRMATSGAIKRAAAHPVTIVAGHLAVMHNGTIHGLNNNKLSDTQVLARILRTAYTVSGVSAVETILGAFAAEGQRFVLAVSAAADPVDWGLKRFPQKWPTHGGVPVSNEYTLETDPSPRNRRPRPARQRRYDWERDWNWNWMPLEEKEQNR